MASTLPLRTLVRTTLPTMLRSPPTIISSASFATTTPLLATAGPPPVKSRRDLPKKVKKTYKKKQNITPVKKPQPGERKAFRKRIQLSNNSALPVEGTETLAPETLARSESSGRMFGLPEGLVDQLRALEAFKTTQSWNLFRKPHVLVRRETVDLVGRLEAAAGEKKAAKLVLVGSRLSGKSMALLQAMSYALLNGWVVIHIPEGQDLTNGNTEYSPVPESDPIKFTQPVYCLKLLQNIYQANKAVLDKLPLSKDFSHLKAGESSLADLVLSAKESENAWPTLDALWSELTAQPGRPPVLFALDGLAHINRVSEYRDPSYKPVHAHELVLVRMFVDALAGKTPLANGGAVVAATSENNTLHHPSQELALAQLEAGQAGRPVPPPNPYERGYDDRVYEALLASELLRFEGLSKDEARVLMEYWGASGMLRSVLNSRTVAEKWALGGHGNVGEMERASLMTMRM